MPCCLSKDIFIVYESGPEFLANVMSVVREFIRSIAGRYSVRGAHRNSNVYGPALIPGFNEAAAFHRGEPDSRPR